MDVSTEELLAYHRARYYNEDKELREFILNHEVELFGKTSQTQFQLGDLIVDSEYYETGVYEETEEVKKYLEFKQEHQRKFEQEQKARSGNVTKMLNY